MKNILLHANLPDDWSLHPVGDVFTFVKSYAFSRDNLVQGMMDGEGVGNIHYGDIHSTFTSPSIDLSQVSIPAIKDRSFVPKNEDLLKDGDLIMADASEDYEGVGVTVSVHGLKNRKVVGGLHTFVLRDVDGNTDEYYRQYIFRNPKIRNELQKIANGVSVYGISKTALSKILLPLPPLPEQRRIVSILETWDKAIDDLAKSIHLKNITLIDLSEKLLSGRLRLPGFSDEWNLRKMGELFEERNELKQNNLPLLSITAEDGVIYQSDSNKKDTSNADKSKYKHICPGDIGYNTMRLWQGRCALSSLEGIVSPAYTIVVPKTGTNSEYFARLFKTPRLIYSFFQHSQGIVSDTLNCKYKDFALVRCRVPSADEQAAIAKVLVSFEQEVVLLSKKLKNFRSQRTYILNALVTGAIRTTEIDVDEVATKQATI